MVYADLDMWSRATTFGDMRAIGVRELKAHLSQVLRDVQAGEDVLITDRGRVIAELRRPGAASESANPVDRALARLSASGALRLGEPQPDPYPTSPISLPDGTALALLDEVRGER